MPNIDSFTYKSISNANSQKLDRKNQIDKYLPGLNLTPNQTDIGMHP